jgi:hypothetical protein
MMCEKCWADAYDRMMFVNPLKTQAEHCRELLEERRNNPCKTVRDDARTTSADAPKQR